MSQLVPALLRPARVQRYRLVGDGPSSVPRPHDAPQGHAPGENPDRVLVFGNGIAMGWGVGTHELAIPGQLARALSQRTGRGADVDLLADMRWDVESAASVLSGDSLGVYDAIVIVMGASDAYRFTSPRKWAEGLVRLIDAFERHTAPLTGIFVMGIQPVSSIPIYRARPGGETDRWADHLNQLTFAICQGHPRAHFVSPPENCLPTTRQGSTAEEHRYRSPERFRQWALTMADAMTPHLEVQAAPESETRAARDRPQSRDRRLAAIWDAGLDGSPSERRFDEIVARAAQAFGTRGAAFTVIGGDRQWNKAVAGIDAGPEASLETSFCRVTIEHSTPLVVQDAWSDARVPGEDAPMRFYAGYPVETADGTRIGALCVFDSEPREGEDVDVSMLRELALQIQHELGTVPVS